MKDFNVQAASPSAQIAAQTAAFLAAGKAVQQCKTRKIKVFNPAA